MVIQKNKRLKVLILTIIMLIFMTGVIYIIKNIDKQELQKKVDIDSNFINTNSAQSSSAEEENTTTSSIQSDDDIVVTKLDKDAQEVFKGQPGYIKSVVKKENSLVLNVDFITQNPKWRLWGTEGFSPDEPFYINQNPKIRSFNITDKTKLGKCSLREEDIINVEDFLKELERFIAKKIELGYLFSTKGSEAISIMMVCVP